MPVWACGWSRAMENMLQQVGTGIFDNYKFNKWRYGDLANWINTDQQWSMQFLGVLIHFAIDQHQGECKEKQKTAGLPHASSHNQPHPNSWEWCAADVHWNLHSWLLWTWSSRWDSERRQAFEEKGIDIYKLSGISMSVCIGLRISLQEIVVFTQKYRCASSQPNLGHSMIIMII